MTDAKRNETPHVLPQENRFLSGLGTDFQVLLFPYNLPKIPNSKASNEGIEILLIEDNSMDASIILEVIEASKYKCIPIVKSNAQDALLFLKQCSNETISERTLILLDLILPGMSGLDLLAELRREAQFKTIPVAILTASTEARHIAASADQSVVCYMTKPGSLKQFNMLVKAFDELLGALFSPSAKSTTEIPSIGPTFIGQSNKGLTGNPKLR